MKITGTVVKGDGRGRTLGYPTANISVPEGLSAENGVYAAVVELGGERYGAMANLGVKPTFSGGFCDRCYRADYEKSRERKTLTACLFAYEVRVSSVRRQPERRW